MAVDDRDLERLRQQLQDAYRKMNAMNREMEERSSRMRRQMKQMQKDMLASTQELQKDIVDRWSRLESEMCQTYAEELRSVQDAYEEQVKQVRAREAEYDHALKELQAEQKAVMAEKDRQDRKAMENAQEQAEKLEEALRKAGEYPVEAFFPHRLQHYREAGERAAQLMREGLYTLAANDYSNSVMGVEGVVEDSKKRLSDIDMMFGLYGSMLERIDFINSGEKELRDKDDQVVLSLDSEEDLDYWSDALYGALLSDVREHKQVMEDGPEKWIERNAGKGTPPELLLDNRIRSLEYIPAQFEKCVSYALSACDSYNKIFSIRDEAIQILAEQNYFYDCTRFGPCAAAGMDTLGYQHYRQWLVEEECIDASKEPDYREERCMQFLNEEGNLCWLHMIPVRRECVVGYQLWLESCAEHVPAKVGETLRHVLVDGLHENVGLVTDGNVPGTDSGRVLTMEELKVLSAVPAESQIRAKYCVGV